MENKIAIGLHSKSRAKKGKRIPLMNDTEADIDLSHIESYPMLWVRLDPDMILLRRENVIQPAIMWQMMLKYERDICAQILAADNLVNFPSEKTGKVLKEIIEDESHFWRVRVAAAHAMTGMYNKVQMKMTNMLEDQRATSSNYYSLQQIKLNYIRRHYLEKYVTIPKKNRFQRNFPDYFVQKAQILALGRLREKGNSTSSNSGICPIEIINLLLELLKFNDNSTCTYSDVFYKASIIEALELAITPGMGNSTNKINQDSLDSMDDHDQFDTKRKEKESNSWSHNLEKLKKLPEIARKILNTATVFFNYDQQLPQFQFIVSQKCLKVFWKLQKLNYTPADASIFVHYAKPGHFVELRKAAIQCLVEFVHKFCCDRNNNNNGPGSVNVDSLFKFLIYELALNDQNMWIRHVTLKFLIEAPPFRHNSNNSLNMKINSPELCEKLWEKIFSPGEIDTRHISDIRDLYQVLYGLDQPDVIKPMLKEKMGQKQLAMQDDIGDKQKARFNFNIQPMKMNIKQVKNDQNQQMKEHRDLIKHGPRASLGPLGTANTPQKTSTMPSNSKLLSEKPLDKNSEKYRIYKEEKKKMKKMEKKRKRMEEEKKQQIMKNIGHSSIANLEFNQTSFTEK